MERIVASVWQDALGVASVGMNDNFFDLGAHSLTVAEVQANLQETHLARNCAGRSVSVLHGEDAREPLAGTQPNGPSQTVHSAAGWPGSAERKA